MNRIAAVLAVLTLAACGQAQQTPSACFNINPACQAQFLPTGSTYDAPFKITTYAPTGYPMLHIQNAEGTPDNPQASACGDQVGAWTADGYDGTNFASAGFMVTDTQQAWDVMHHGSLMYFGINPPNNLAGSGTLLSLQANTTGMCPAMGPVPAGTAPTVVIIGPNSNQAGGGPANTAAFVNGNSGATWGGTQVGVVSSRQQGSTSLMQFYSDVNATHVIAEVLVGGEFRHVPVPFSSLPPCTPGPNGTEGTSAAVNDSTASGWGQAISGGGGFHVKAYCDGKVWTVEAR